jgi:hypothetical protein
MSCALHTVEPVVNFWQYVVTWYVFWPYSHQFILRLYGSTCFLQRGAQCLTHTKQKIKVLFSFYVNRKNTEVFTCIWSKGVELRNRHSLPWRSWRIFLDTPFVCQDCCTPNLHTLDHITKESEVHRKREKVHTHYRSLTFSLLSGPVAEAAERKPSRKRQHDFLQTTHYTAWCLLCSSTFIHYRPLYLNVASHWFNSNVSAWRQVSPPFGFQCLKDWDKEGRCGQESDSIWSSNQVL